MPCRAEDDKTKWHGSTWLCLSTRVYKSRTKTVSSSPSYGHPCPAEGAGYKPWMPSSRSLKGARGWIDGGRDQEQGFLLKRCKQHKSKGGFMKSGHWELLGAGHYASLTLQARHSVNFLSFAGTQPWANRSTHTLVLLSPAADHQEPGRREPLREQQGLAAALPTAGAGRAAGAGAQGDPARRREGPGAAAGAGERPLEPLGGR